VSILSLLTRDVTLIHRAQAGEADAYGNSSWAETGRTRTKCYLEQLPGGREITIDRQTQIAEALLVLPGGTGLEGSDHVEVDGVTYEVLGPPNRVHVPGSGEHHVEANLRAVTG
jgi:hypothetical protein